jgi:flagellar hook-associated protein 1 FlgK
MSDSIFQIATSGLLAARYMFETTSHNIANATTEGYSRQRVDLNSRSPQYLGTNFFGRGVEISSIRRLQNDFVDTQVRTHLSSYEHGLARTGYAERIDSLLADSETGFAPPLADFFDGLQDMASDPTSATARQVALSDTEALVNRLHVINERVEEQRVLLNKEIKTAITEINTLAETVVRLNRDIVAGYGMSGSLGGPPNDLLDQRGVALNKLAEKVDIRVVEQDDRSVTVYVGTGQPLVLSGGAKPLVAEILTGDPRNVDIGYPSITSGGGTSDITKFITGGQLGGLLTVREEIFDAAQNGIGQITVALGLQMNIENQLGLDLNGEQGQAIFELSTPYVGAYHNNSATSNPTAEFIPEAISDLTNSDYRLSFDGTTYTLTRLRDDVAVATGISSDTLEVDGFALDLSTISGAAAGDHWTIQPTRFAAETVEMTIQDGAEFAATSGALEDARNTGDAQLVGLEVTDLNDPDTQIPAAIHYDGTHFNVYAASYGGSGDAVVDGFQITDVASLATTTVTYDAANEEFDLGTGESIPLDPTGTTLITGPGWELKIDGVPDDLDTFNIGMTATGLAASQPAVTTVNGQGWTVDIYGEPEAGDLFTVDLSPNRQGDNRNMRVIAGLAEERLIEHNASYADGYNNVLATVGTRTNQAQIERDASSGLLEQAQAQRDAVSGVNLDEEASNMLLAQQHYQASGQVIAVASTLFQTLLDAL